MFGGAGPSVPPGSYRIVLTVDGQEMSQSVRVEADPSRTGSGIAEGEDADK
jgi:hypothetical protein